MSAPRGLKPRGRALYRSVERGLPAGWELDEREREILVLAARQADDLAALEAALKRDGMVVRGSARQPRLNPAVSELRQGRLALGRLLGQLDLPDADEQPQNEASRRARHAATSRWARVASVKQRREASRGA